MLSVSVDTGENMYTASRPSLNTTWRVNGIAATTSVIFSDVLYMNSMKDEIEIYDDPLEKL